MVSAESGGSPAWVTGLLCPTLGTIICNMMWLSPMKVQHYLFPYLFLNLFIYTFNHSFFYLFINQSAHLFVYRYIYLFAYSFFYLFAHLSINIFISLFLFVFIFQAILDVRSSLDLGSLNPIPFGITILNCIGKYALNRIFCGSPLFSYAFFCMHSNTFLHWTSLCVIFQFSDFLTFIFCSCFHFCFFTYP